jgi:hypothetical protein
MRFNFFIPIVLWSLLFTACTSGKHTAFLRKHQESIPLQQADWAFESLDEDFYANQLFFVGEIHEVATSPRIDLTMFQQLHRRGGVRTYIGEMDIAQGYFLNEYIKGSDEMDLREILAEWVVGIGQYSSEVREKYTALRTYYQGLPEGEKFEVLGIEMNTDEALIRKLLSRKLQLPIDEIPAESEALIKWGKEVLPELIRQAAVKLSQNDADMLSNIQYNFEQYKPNWYWFRDKYSYHNFKRIFAQRNWSEEKLYACFGFAHTLQAYSYTLAGRIKQDTSLSLSNRIVSMNALYVDSHLTVTSAGLPGFMRSKEDFTRLKLSYDSRLFMYLKGISDYKKVSEKSTITLFRLDADDSPYRTSLRGTRNFALIPIWDGFKIEDKNTVTTDYAQYIFLVRNADWVVPDASIQ